MKKKVVKKILNIKIIIMTILLFSLLLSPNVLAKSNHSYNYDYYSEIKAAPASYDRKKVLTSKELQMGSEIIKDVLVLKDEDRKINDTQMLKVSKIISTDSKIYLYDENYNKLNVITEYEKVIGNPISFKKISSLATLNKKLYVGARKTTTSPIGKIIIFKIEDHGLVFEKELIIDDKAKIPGIKNYVPKKIAVSKTGAIYILLADSVQGILELEINQVGNIEFKRFIGSNKIVLSAAESFWKKIAPSSKKTTNYVQVSFSSLAVDNKGFIYTTTSSKGSKPIQKLNFKGENVLLENGSIPVIGDVYEQDSEYHSVFIDICVNDFGIYLALDSFNDAPGKKKDLSRNKVFAYNSSGDLLYIIGNKGEKSRDYLDKPEVIRWDKEDIVILDNGDNFSRIYIYSATDYGKNINTAVKHYENGDFELSLPYWKKSLEQNSNNELAYTGIGKVNLRNKDYESAVINFKKANNKIYYSKAYAKIRNKKLTKAFVPAILVAALIAITLKGVFIWLDKKL